MFTLNWGIRRPPKTFLLYHVHAYTEMHVLSFFPGIKYYLISLSIYVRVFTCHSKCLFFHSLPLKEYSLPPKNLYLKYTKLDSVRLEKNLTLSFIDESINQLISNFFLYLRKILRTRIHSSLSFFLLTASR